jgi:hypothetical protein
LREAGWAYGAGRFVKAGQSPPGPSHGSRRKIIPHSSLYLLPSVGGEGAGGLDAAGVFLAQRVDSRGGLVSIVRTDTCSCSCLLALVEQPLRQGRSGSYSGEAERAHGEAEAERLLARGLAALDLAEDQLAETRKGAREKEVLAWWLCRHTTARRRWVSERLGMGDESRVTQAIGRLKRKGQPELERLKRRLEQVYENHNAEVEARIFRD